MNNSNKPQFIIGSRQSGKTMLLINEASKTGGIIVCPTSKMADYVFRTARELGFRISKPISYAAFLMHPEQMDNRALYFDEYGMTLVDFLRFQLADFEHYNARSFIIDKESIDSLNDILGELNVSDMSGKRLQFKIDILGRNDNDDQD